MSRLSDCTIVSTLFLKPMHKYLDHITTTDRKGRLRTKPNGAVMVVIVWWLHLSMQSLPITTKVVNSNQVHGELYSIQHYVIKFVSNLRQVGGFLRDSTTKKPNRHDITEILLKVALPIATLTRNWTTKETISIFPLCIFVLGACILPLFYFYFPTIYFNRYYHLVFFYFILIIKYDDYLICNYISQRNSNKSNEYWFSQ